MDAPTRQNSSLPTALFPAAPCNYGSRQNTYIDTVVIHTTEGAYHSALLWFANPAAKASAHYVISRDGALAQSVPEGMEAFHAGNSAVNRRSIGIELEGYAEQGWIPPGTQLEALVRLLADVCARHTIPIDRAHIYGHADVDDPSNRIPNDHLGGLHHHRDPGPAFPWDALFAQLHALSRPA